MNSHKKTTTKKPYKKPILKIYGSAGVLTAAIANFSMSSAAGAGAMNNTH
jgi:hypothetical protein